MPAMITHYLFGVDLYRSTSIKNIKSIIYHNIGPYRLGLQGPDIFFYHPILMLLPKEKHIGSRMHETKVQAFFSAYLTLLEKLPSKDQTTAYAYLLGLLAHYTLDSSIHPYIYARCSTSKNTSSNQFSFGKHLELETYIDSILLKRHRNQPLPRFHASRTFHFTWHELSLLCSLLSRTIKKVYSERHYFATGKNGTIIAILSTKIAASILNSRKGHRKVFLNWIEHWIFPAPIISHAFHKNHLPDRLDAFNRSHRAWHNPWINGHSSRLGVDALYQTAIQRYLAILPYLEDYLNTPGTDKKMPLLKEIGNLSYHSGTTCV